MKGFSGLQAVCRSRRARYGTNTALMILIMTAILALIGAITTKHPWRYDLTENQRYTLSDESRKVLDALESEVRVTAFLQKASPSRLRLQDLLEQYEYHSRKFSFEFVDPDHQPGRAKSLNVTKYGTIVFQSGENTEKIRESTEEKITNAILKVTRKTKKIIYFLTGHGEPDINDLAKDGNASAKKAVEDKGYQVKTLLLMQEKEVPEDASILVVAGPRKALFGTEQESIQRYIARGGKVFFMLDPLEAPGMEAFLKQYGIALGDDIIIDRMSRIFGAEARIPVISKYQRHPITERFNIVSFFPLARTVEVEKELPKGVTAQRLAMTGPAAWAEKEIKSALEGKISQSPEERKGPLSVAAVATVEISETQGTEDGENPGGTDGSKRNARIVVFGDSDFVNNAYLGLSGNRDLFLNTISWLAEEENLISIRAKESTGRPMLLTARQGRVLFWLPVVVLPSLVIGTGITIFLRRRLKG
ncbi:MAG: GldG family protein [Deltaproteobacteria bacterium]|nr:GldG family protein [Deltaproteobacteria bacterium]